MLHTVSSFRFVHTADIHLDSPLKGLAGYDGAAAERIRTACREAFDALVSVAIEERAAFMVIAGDLYDGDWRDYQTGLFFAGQMGRLARAGIRAFVLHGNHDAESQLTRRLQLPDNVRTFSARKPETIELKELGVALHGQSFGQRDVSENMALAYPKPVDGAVNIGVLHTGLGGLTGAGTGGHANYAPCTLEDLVNKGYDYWALGHVHKGGVLRERPYVVFPGNIQGRHIRETGPKGAYLVTVEDGEIAGLEFFPTDVVRWAMVTVAAGGCARMAEAVDLMRDAIGEAVANEADGRLLACRIEIRGRTADPRQPDGLGRNAAGGSARRRPGPGGAGRLDRAGGRGHRAGRGRRSRGGARGRPGVAFAHAGRSGGRSGTAWASGGRHRRVDP